MADVQGTCITKPPPQSPHEHITHLGNPAANWKWTREQVISSIEAKTNTFYVVDPRAGKRADIGEKNGNTRIDTLRNTYGPDFAPGIRGDAHLRTLLDRTGHDTLSEYLKNRT